MSDIRNILVTDDAQREIKELPARERARVVSRIELLRRKGWQLSAQAQDIKRLDGEIWEIRVVGKGPAYRLLCFQAPGQPGRIVVVTSCIAKSAIAKRLRMNADVQRAENRRQEWITQYGDTK